jgi:hypothetical protein
MKMRRICPMVRAFSSFVCPCAAQIGTVTFYSINLSAKQQVKAAVSPVGTIRQYRSAALIDELHLAVRPILLGSGEHLLNGIDLCKLGYECSKSIAGERATHVFLRKSVSG